MKIKSQCCTGFIFLLAAMFSVLEGYSTTPHHGLGFRSEWTKIPYPHFDDNPLFGIKEKRATRRYLLPRHHPLAPILEQLFMSRVTLDRESLVAAGFHVMASQPRSLIQVVTHPLLPRYVIKLYFDTTLGVKWGIPGWKWFIYRCRGARKVKRVIERHHLKYFVVPDKWIYPLPAPVGVPNDPIYDFKHTILIADEMPLVPKAENKRLWKEAITEEHLVELMTILSYASSIRSRPDNMHFLPDGRIALIDTEYANKSPDFLSIRAYLSPKMLAFWDLLVDYQGP